MALTIAQPDYDPIPVTPLIVPTWANPDTGLETCFCTVPQTGQVLFDPSIHHFSNSIAAA